MKNESKNKMNNASLWLLEYLRFLLPNGLSPTTKMPTTAPKGVSMKTLRGLEKRGYARVEKHIWFITSLGVDAITT
jgi:hypothetical protein